MQVLSVATVEPRLQLHPAPRTHSRTKLFYVVGVPAGAIYILYQLGLQGLRQVKEGAIATGCELISMADSGAGEAEKLARFLPKTALGAIKPPVELVGAVCRENLQPGVAARELDKLDTACGQALSELIQPPVELIADVGWEGLTLLGAGAQEAQKFVVNVPESIQRAAVIPATALGDTLYELYSYLPPGTYQMQELSTFAQKILLELVRKEMLQAWLIEFFSSAHAGLKEVKKGAITGKESAVELALLTKEAITQVNDELESCFEAGRREDEKGHQAAVHALKAAYDTFKGPARDCVRELFQTLSAGSKEAKKGAITLPDATLNATELPRELLLGMTIELLWYLASAEREADKSLHTFIKSLKEGTTVPRELLTGLAKEYLHYLYGAAREGDKGLKVLPNSLFQATRIPVECAEAILEELTTYLKSGTNEAIKFNQMLTEDVPNTFQVMVLDPMEMWWLPKKQLLIAWALESQVMIKDAINEIHQRWFRK